MPSISLDAPVSAAGRLTKTNKAALETLGIATVRDLVFRFPFRHEDFTKTVPIEAAEIGEPVTILAKVTAIRQRKSFRRKLSMAEASLRDDYGGAITAVWFNQPYISEMLPKETPVRFAGKVTKTKMGLRLVNPLFQAGEAARSGDSAHASPLVPVYSTPAGLSQHAIRRLMHACKPLLAKVAEHLPTEVRKAEKLAPLATALVNIHFPTTGKELAAAKKRLAFDELLRLQLAVGKLRRERRTRQAPAVPFDLEATKSFVDSLPFTLTDDQRRSAWEIIQDMGKDSPMSRLLDGDVGSGKTVVAAIPMINAAKAGFQSAMMAPTEILAKQHFETMKRMFAEAGVSLALWTNSYKRSAADGREIEAKGKKAVDLLNAEIAEGKVAAVVGTHALTEDALSFDRLALAIIDEQHRFGVNTRQKLVGKSGLSGTEPHLLSMTATPIPRSLALTVYGDLDLSLLRQKPADRLPVITKLYPPTVSAKAFEFIKKEVEDGRQAFVVCPLIKESDKLGAVSVTEAYERLSAIELHGIPMAMLHGQLAADEKEKVMADFLAKKTMVLVSTSVVEVGVDVPNATVIAIEGAERFGLAQLHQFRGRVGRGKCQSYCYLLPSKVTDDSLERLRALAATADGFELAEKDMKMRGIGQLLGTSQSGHSGLNVASLANLPLVKKTREVADRLLDQDASLSQWPGLAEFVGTYGAPEQVHLE